MKQGLKRFGFGLLLLSVAPPLGLWIWWQERRILRGGWPLSDLEQDWARSAGVTEPERIRVLSVARVPMPLPARTIDWLYQRFGVGVGPPVGMCIRYGIFLDQDYMPNPGILVHEFVHTAQYERLGILRFLWLYLHQCAVQGYLGAPLEYEANTVSRRVLETSRTQAG